jgi:hypothetical protein
MGAALVPLAGTLFSSLLGGLFGGKEDKPAAAPEQKRPDETSEGIADARRRRRAAPAGRAGLRSSSVDSDGQTRGGLTIAT